METYGYIYITTNTINGNRYIGQHKSVDWDSQYIGSGKLLHYAIKKYGKENFTCFPLAWAWSREELNQLEIDYIAHYKPEYNIAKGGEGGILGDWHRKILLSNETRKRISEKNKRQIGFWKGRNRSEETKKKISEANKDKHHSEETRKKMSEIKKLYWKSKKIAWK
jgi:group I intron endonuclease